MDGRLLCRARLRPTRPPGGGGDRGPAGPRRLPRALRRVRAAPGGRRDERLERGRHQRGAARGRDRAPAPPAPGLPARALDRARRPRCTAAAAQRGRSVLADGRAGLLQEDPGHVRRHLLGGPRHESRPGAAQPRARRTGRPAPRSGARRDDDRRHRGRQAVRRRVGRRGHRARVPRPLPLPRDGGLHGREPRRRGALVGLLPARLRAVRGQAPGRAAARRVRRGRAR